LARLNKNDESTRFIYSSSRKFKKKLTYEAIYSNGSLCNSSESIVLTFCQSKENIDRFYHMDKDSLLI
jgi:hypothetical protein